MRRPAPPSTPRSADVVVQPPWVLSAILIVGQLGERLELALRGSAVAGTACNLAESESRRLRFRIERRGALERRACNRVVAARLLSSAEEQFRQIQKMTGRAAGDRAAQFLARFVGTIEVIE